MSKRSVPLTSNEVVQKVRWLWNHGEVIPTIHFKAELKNAGATMADVEVMFFGSCQVESEQWDETRRSWKYRIAGVDEDGELLQVVVALDLKNSKMILVTAF